MKKSKSLLASILYQLDIKKVRGKILNIYEIGKNFRCKLFTKKSQSGEPQPIDKSGAGEYDVDKMN